MPDEGRKIVILERSDRIHMRHPERSVTESKDLGLNL